MPLVGVSSSSRSPGLARRSGERFQSGRRSRREEHALDQLACLEHGGGGDRVLPPWEPAWVCPPPRAGPPPDAPCLGGAAPPDPLSSGSRPCGHCPSPAAP